MNPRNMLLSLPGNSNPQKILTPYISPRLLATECKGIDLHARPVKLQGKTAFLCPVQANQVKQPRPAHGQNTVSIYILTLAGVIWHEQLHLDWCVLVAWHHRSARG
jgi:hypothetical protein